MSEIRYLISDASKKVDVETHVLRYWEEELGLSIPRNEMGHRYYTEFHIHLFCQIKKLKDSGYQLKAIKSALQQTMAQNQGFMQAAGILEEDMARTLQENQGYLFLKKDKEILPEGIMRLADYNRLEPVEERPIIRNSQMENKSLKIEKIQLENKRQPAEKIQLAEKTQPTEKTQSADKHQQVNNKQQTEKYQPADKNQLTPQNQQPKENQRPEDKAVSTEKQAEEENKWEENIHHNIQNKPELKEKDGQTEMKKKGRNRKKPSAWERRNGIAENRQDNIQENYDVENDQKDNYRTSEYAEDDYNVSEYAAQEKFSIEYTAEENTTEKHTKEYHKDENTQEEYLADNQSLSDTQETISAKETTVSSSTELTTSSADQPVSLTLLQQNEKMQQFQDIMNHIIGQALEANTKRLSQEISGLVNEHLAEEMEDFLRIRDERDEERFRQLDEIIRSYQRDSQGKAEAAAARVPFLGKGWFKRHRLSQNSGTDF